MTKAEIQNSIIKKIKNLKSKALLEEIQRMLSIEENANTILKLSASQKNSVIKGKKEISSGKYLTNKEANALVEKWLSE